MLRETVETYPPFFWKISCPATIMGETKQSNHDLGLNEMAFAGVISGFPNDFQSKNR